jgi:c-di-GMP-binding flagellar brake protein YcgR
LDERYIVGPELLRGPQNLTLPPKMHPYAETGFSERRQHVRVALRLPVQLFRTSDTGRNPVKMATSNISAGGFYGVCIETFLRDEQLECIVEMFKDLQSFQPRLNIECNVRVVRVEPLLVEGQERFGVAFRIEDYWVTDGSPSPFAGAGGI